MTRTPNDRTNPPVGTRLPEGADPIDTGTPVRRPGTPDPATRTATGMEKETEPEPAGPAEDGPHPGKPLFAPEEREAFAARIQQAVTGFVEDPRRAVRDADATYEEVVADLGAALAERGRRLRSGKDGSGADSGADTEDLRIALQHYRDLTERLVRL
ncbi:hypothetical protein [Streptomyces sp. PTY087I2]|uniref:hypothetical protein n=1 Tax=Streptomyces sp. PTY087I2 TaxID=1819298 RepID=UPI00080B9B44|nr:hypothetical protein [Streptomyces sp. PTY087I2]OCC11084.1 hypothetical protein A3Q37_03202 [Streptomyces sp. PTY087I2]